MADPRPLTRKELAEFLPSQRAIRAFEKLLDIVPPELETLLQLTESASLLASSAKLENAALRQLVRALQLEIERLEQQIDALQLVSAQRINLDQLVKRIEVLETLEG